MISAAAGILFINLPPRVPQHFDASTVSSSSHFSACWVFVACFFAISSNIIIINVQFAKALIVRQTMTQFQHLSTCCRSKVWVSHPCQAITVLQRFHQLPWSNWGVWRSWSPFTNQSLKQGAKGLHLPIMHCVCFLELRDSNSPFFALWNHGRQILRVSPSFIQFHHPFRAPISKIPGIAASTMEPGQRWSWKSR